MSNSLQSAAPPRPPFQFSLRTLFLLFVVLGTSLGAFRQWGILVFALVVGLAVFITGIKSLKLLAYLLVAILSLMYLLGTLLSVGSVTAHEALLGSCLNRMHQLGLALQNYCATNGHFPLAYTVDKASGKRLHSWRTLILPYFGKTYIYNQVDLAQPWNAPRNKAIWDSPKNKTDLDYLHRYYVCPSDPSSAAEGSVHTNYVAVIGPGTAWARDKTMKLSDFGEDAPNTIMLVEVVNSGVAWAEPRDLELEKQGNTVGGASALTISSHHGNGEDFFFTYDRPFDACVAMADGSARYLPPAALLPENLPKLLRIGGCKQEDLDRLEASFVVTQHPRWRNIASLAVWLLSVAALLIKAVRSRKATSRLV